MKEERYFYVPTVALSGELPEEEATHALRVLRLKAGDELMLMDGQGTFYQASVAAASGKHCLYHVEQAIPQEHTWPGHLHLAIAPTKMMERMEWLVEKATEVGFDELSLLDCRFSERHVVKAQRLERIVVAAMKQSRKAWKPVVNDMQDFQSFIAAHRSNTKKFIAHCYSEIPRENLFNTLSKLPPGGDLLVLVGPEGDFSIDEVRMAVEAGFTSVDLGPSRLRTETAGLAAVMMMQLSQQQSKL
ncbi:MAG: 16S rRNA (uracil(1498)-N(3))-methyltransferase [Prevotella sp.]|nr:16S rRNA (uracil(1498)-N(3))-methyltransferase [Prevotella sp.]